MNYEYTNFHRGCIYGNYCAVSIILQRNLVSHGWLYRILSLNLYEI